LRVARSSCDVVASRDLWSQVAGICRASIRSLTALSLIAETILPYK